MALATPETDTPETDIPQTDIPQTEPSSRVPDAAALRGAVDVVAGFLASFEPGRYSGSDAVVLVGVFARGKKLCAAGETLSAHRADECQAHLRTGHRTAAEWLTSVTGASPGEAVDQLKLGQALSDQPAVEEALRKGALTPSRATLVSEAAKVNPSKEADLVRGAEGDTFRQLRERCLKATAEGRSAEDAERHRRALHARRRCRTFTDTDGAFRIDALFAPEAGARLKAALEAQADRFFDQARRQGRVETPDAYRADALLALVTGSGILTPKGRAKDGPWGGMDRPRGRTDPEGPDASGGPERTPDPKATLFVQVGLQTLRRGQVQPGECCEIPGVGPVPVEYARGLLGTALVELFITDGVDVSTVYSAGRHIPRRVYSALMQRDPTCVVPGCDARLGLENDHWVVEFAKGGLASMDNVARVCRHHHQLRTHRGFQLLGGPGKWRWVPPEDPVVPTRPKKGRRTKAPPPPGADPPLFHHDE
jgi:hypothetical protein